MRKLMLFSVGFLVACGLSAYCLPGMWLPPLGAFCLFSAIAIWFLKKKPARVTALILLGCAIGAVWNWGFHLLYLSTAQSYDGQICTLAVTASDYSYAPNFGQAFDGRVDLDGKHYRVRCYLNEDTAVVPGNVVEGEFRLRYTVKTGSFKPGYHQSKGIFLVASQKGEVSVTPGPVARRDYPALWRNGLLSMIGKIFPEDTAAFAKALLLGDSSDLSYEQDRSFQICGIRHVIAVSGLHVSILFALIHMGFGYNRFYNVVLGFPALFLFAAVAGFTPSVVRACIMQALMILSLLFDREEDPLTALAFSALVILVVNPLAVTSVSFQLSASCTLGIVLFANSVKAYIFSFGKLKKKSKGNTKQAKFIRWLTGSVSVTVSAMVFTTPLCAAYFGLVSLMGLLANILVLWVISFVFYGIMIACVLAAIWVPLGKIIAWLVAWPIRYVTFLSKLLAHVPLAAVYTDSIYVVCWLILSYILLLTFFLLNRKHPAVTAACIAVSLCVCLMLSWLEPRLDTTRLSVIDVGQGQSILWQCENRYYLVDCGSEAGDLAADKTANFLLSQGIFRLDGVILTHYDTDHAGSVENLLFSVDANRIYLPDIPESNDLKEQILSVAGERAEWIRDEIVIPLEKGSITLYPAKTTAGDNESSVCVLFQSENCDILITGDRSGLGERRLLETADIPDLDVLVAGHHGSKNATSLELLQATLPETVIISAGEDNLYGHPHQQVLDRLESYGCSVYRTDLNGTIIYRR